MKKRKWLCFMMMAFLLLLGFTARIYGDSNTITRQELQSPNTQSNRRSIAQKVLNDTKRTEMFTPEEASNIILYYSDLTGDGENEVIIVVEFGPKNSIVAVYDPQGDQYQYLGDVGSFFYIRNIDFLPVASLGRNIMMIREYADQNIGAYERSSFIRGYLWEDNAFRQVLQIPEGIESYWNDLWDDTTQNGESRWNKIEQRTDIAYEDPDGNPILNLAHYQAYRVSDDLNSKELPPASNFITVNNRMVGETYRWNNEWNRFILSEKIDTDTGEKVAVIEDFAVSPYALLDDFGDNANKVRIERKDGTTAIVDKSILSDIDGSAATDAYIAF